MKKVLLVDNDRFILELLSDALTEEGYQVATAENGLQALDVLKSYTPDIMFVDLVMPHIDGKRLCRIIQKMEKLQNTFVIILSSVLKEEKINVKELQTDACIAKGSFDEMWKDIRETLQQAEKKNSRGLVARTLGVERAHRRQISEELLSAKKHFEIIMDKMSEGIMEMTFEGRVVYANPVALSLVDVPEEKLLGSYFAELFDGENRERVEGLLKRLGKNSTAANEDAPLRLNGYQVTLNIQLTEGEGSTVIVILNDVSERKSAEEALKSEKEKFRVLVEDSPLGVALIGKGGAHKYVNPAFVGIFGYTLGEVPARLSGPEDFVPEEKSRYQGTPMNGGERGTPGGDGGILPRTLAVTGKDGSEKIVNFRPVRLETGDRLVIYEDITERRRLEDQIQHAQKMESLGIITSGVAHNFKNILAGILGNSQLIQMKMYKDDARRDEILSRINSSVRRGTQLVKGLMQFSRKATLKEFHRLNLSKILRDTCQVAEKRLHIQVQTVTDIPESLPVMGDYSGLNQVFLNLMINARDAMPDGGNMQVSAGKEGGKAWVVISDEGHGMDKETLGKCFDPFFTTKDIGEGTGLGLSIAYRIVKDHGGEIHVDSVPDKGTVLKLYFPLADAGT